MTWVSWHSMAVFYVVCMYQIVLDDMGLQAFYGSVLCGIHVSYCPCLHGFPGTP